MTKTIPAVEVTQSTPLAEIIKRPDSITLFGNAYQVLEEYAVHARNGYHLFPGVTPQFFQHTGTMSLLLALGEPLPLASQRAAESMAQAQKQEAAEFSRRVTKEAQRIAAENAKAELEARVAAAQTIADEQVARIRADADAAIARITARA
ncbi:hypothetical protein RCH14_003841 [Massilia sp. MP_M2]|uniref:hypothetical protein n=1 Tax=Massilia sp. MP_M2 TaxID=3071713 RepID=UPI00319E2ECD